MPPRIKIVYKKKDLVVGLNTNNAATGIPQDPEDFLRKFSKLVEENRFESAISELFYLRISQFKKIQNELDSKNPDYQQISHEAITIEKTTLIDKLGHLMSHHWPAISNKCYRNIAAECEKKDKSKVEAAVGLLIQELTKEQHRITSSHEKREFIIEIKG